MKQFFTIIALLAVFSAQIAFAHQPTERVKCQKPAQEYLIDAEKLYKQLKAISETFFQSRTRLATEATAAALLYQICSELEKNTGQHSYYSVPLDPATPDPPAGPIYNLPHIQFK